MIGLEKSRAMSGVPLFSYFPAHCPALEIFVSDYANFTPLVLIEC